LGFTAAVLAIQLVQSCNPALNPAIVPLLLGVPLLDTVYAVLRRLVAVNPCSRRIGGTCTISCWASAFPSRPWWRCCTCCKARWC
jgi:hypothetical protein